MDIEFPTNVTDGKAEIILSGDLDNEQAGEALRKAFNGLFNRGQRTIILDLNNVEIINSYGIGKILMCMRQLQAESGELRVKPLKGFVKDIFELLMLDSLFPVEFDGSETAPTDETPAEG